MKNTLQKNSMLSFFRLNLLTFVCLSLIVGALAFQLGRELTQVTPTKEIPAEVPTSSGTGNTATGSVDNSPIVIIVRADGTTQVSGNASSANVATAPQSNPVAKAPAPRSNPVAKASAPIQAAPKPTTKPS